MSAWPGGVSCLCQRSRGTQKVLARNTVSRAALLGSGLSWVTQCRRSASLCLGFCMHTTGPGAFLTAGVWVKQVMLSLCHCEAALGSVPSWAFLFLKVFISN